MRYAYPVELEEDEDARVVAWFPDVPGASTDGPGPTDALASAEDSLVAALGGYVALGRPIPAPGPARGRPIVAPPALVAAKLALYEALRAQGWTRTALARRLGVSEGAVRRLLDLDHRSHIGQVDRALAALGKRLVVEVFEAA